MLFQCPLLQFDMQSYSIFIALINRGLYYCGFGAASKLNQKISFRANGEIKDFCVTDGSTGIVFPVESF